MATFFMFGKYSSDAIKKISVKRTEQAIDTIQSLGGETNGVYALLGEYDLLFCVKLRNTMQSKQVWQNNVLLDYMEFLPPGC